MTKISLNKQKTAPSSVRIKVAALSLEPLHGLRGFFVFQLIAAYT